MSAAAQESRLRAALAALSSIAPRDAMEGMLAAQMVATHGAAMECLGRAMLPGQAEPDREINLRHAAKLLSLYGRQMDTLNRHRGRGQQTVTVQHVQVEAGGQAIVGAVRTGPARGGRRGSRDGGGSGGGG